MVRNAKITSKGQITVPIEIRRMLGVNPGDLVSFIVSEGSVRVARETDPDAFKRWEGRFRIGKGENGAQINRRIRYMRGHDDE